MASNAYTSGVREMFVGNVDYLVDTIKVLLGIGSYTPNKDHDFLDEAGANDPTDHELNVTGYTRGFNGAGRKTLASKTITVDDANDRVEFDCADITWTALGAGQTIAWAIVVKEVTNDAATQMLCYLDVTDTPTNGSDITLQIGADGFLQAAT